MAKSKTGGRKAGTPNVLSATAKENIVAVFTRLGGTGAMAEWAKENMTEFYRIYARLLPHEIDGNLSHTHFVATVPAVVADSKEWQQQHAPTIQ